MKTLLYDVASGKKLSCFENNDDTPKLAKELGLECILSWRFPSSQIQNAFSSYAVAKRQRFSDVLGTLQLPDKQTIDLEIWNRLEKLIKKLPDKSLAKVLKFLDRYPRVDSVYDVSTDNLERPEVALLEGALLGYPACCVEYYIKVNYLNMPEQTPSKTKVKKSLRSKTKEYEYARCPRCYRETKVNKGIR